MAGINLKTLKQEEIRNILNSFDTVLSDCDGVLWIGHNAIAGAPETVKKLRDRGKRFFYVTNNCTKTRDEFLNMANKLNFEAKLDDIMCTSYLAVMYLKSINFTKKAFIVGSSGISKEFELAGIRHIGVGPDVLTGDLKTMITNFTPDPEVGAVVVGFDAHFSYPKLLRAVTYLSDPKVLFIATSPDLLVPSGTVKIAGTGALIACIEAASGRKAFVVGKPEPFIRQVIMENYGTTTERTLFIGDSANTDILLGKRCNFKTLLVLSGVTTVQDIEKWQDSNDPAQKELVPDFYTDSIIDLLPYL